MNTITLVGNITQDLTLKDTQSGKKYCRFRLAVPRNFDRQKTDFMTCTAWGKSAEIISQYASKGSKVGIVGTLQMNTWETKDGQKRTDPDILISEIELLSPKKEAPQAPETKINAPSISYAEEMPTGGNPEMLDLPFEF